MPAPTTFSTSNALQLGTVTFYNFEVPEEIPNFFGVQKLAIHDFPTIGQGNRTVQVLGSFPFPMIEWTGEFWNNDVPLPVNNPAAAGTSGGDAIQRASQVNSMRVQAEPVQLTWGPFNLQVMVEEFEVIAKLAQRLAYRIKLVPLMDNTSTSNTGLQAPNPNAVAFNANRGVTAAVTSVPGQLLPPLVQLAATTIATAATAAIINANNNVSNVSTGAQSALQAQILALQLVLNPIMNGNNYGQATAAATLSSALYALSVAMNIGQATSTTTITVTNPNLSVLASTYYGDSSLWPLIASANNLQDVSPIGTFTLVIPPQTTQSALIPTS
jgi:hypothetical protein